MPDDHSSAVKPDQLGESFAGGFYAGRIRVNDLVYGLVVAPRDEGEHAPTTWGKTKGLTGADSFFDGLANTDAMAAAGSKLALWARALRVGGFDDWYLPSRDELELCYRAFKSGTYKNYCISGDNPSSVPVGYAYTPTLPAQTSDESFRSGGDNAFAEDWYWTSTAYAGASESAWYQHFDYGYQDYGHTFSKLRARVVRRWKL